MPRSGKIRVYFAVHNETLARHAAEYREELRKLDSECGEMTNYLTVDSFKPWPDPPKTGDDERGERRPDR